jgi:hypothetical protein
MKLLVSFGSVVTLGLGFGLGLAALNSNADAIRINADRSFKRFIALAIYQNQSESERPTCFRSLGKQQNAR